MDYKDFISGISFHIIQPYYWLPKGYLSIKKILRNIDISIPLEISNTSLPDDEQKLKKSLGKLCRIPRMSTFAISAIINRGVSQMSTNQVFVNIGVWYGFTFLSGMVNNSSKKCIGVDNFSQFDKPKEAF